jgi:arylsulfatase A-like enzyme
MGLVIPGWLFDSPMGVGVPVRRPTQRLGATLAVSLVIVMLPVPSARTPGSALMDVEVVHGAANILLILTDDQRFDSLFAMPHVRQGLMARGVTFTRATVSNAICCPSRAAILTGGYSHTNLVYTNVYTGWSPYGGWRAFHRAGGERATIAKALDTAGYRTALFGKYLNDFPGRSAPPGWDRMAAFDHAHTGGAYYDYSLFVKDAHGSRTRIYGSARDDYSTSVLGRYAMSFLRGTGPEQPFFLYLAPYAPHAAVVPAPRDVGSWSGYRQNLRPNFNEGDLSDKPRYLRGRDRVGVVFTRHRFQVEYEGLQAVDRMVGRIIGYLRSSDRLHDTLIVFMSDNGIMFGEHRWPDKFPPYEESVRVPLVVRYDAVTGPRAGARSSAIVSNVDLAPTFAEATTVPFDGVGTVDGVSLMPLLRGEAHAVRRDLLLEHADYPAKYHVPSYCGLRTSGWVYVRYATGEQELYDLAKDPYELTNVAGRSTEVRDRLRARTRTLCDPPPPGFTWGG